MKRTYSWLLLCLICLTLGSGCTAMAGNLQHWPATIPALGIMVGGKALNDRYPVVKWPMEFILWAAVVLIVFNLVYLHYQAF